MSDKIYVALGPNVFVKEIQRENKVGDFYIPDSLDIDFTFGEVVSASGGYYENGTFIPATVFIGDHVAFPKISGTKVTFNNEKLIRVNMADIVAKEVEGHIDESTDTNKKQVLNG